MKMMGDDGSGEDKVRTVSVLPYNPKVAYFSMEIGIDPEIPTYSGGLGVLAGDTIKSCADLNVPLVAVTLLFKNGYFDQRIDDEGNQVEMPVQFSPASHLTLIARETVVEIEDKPVKIRPWYYLVEGVSGYRVPVIFLDTDLSGNGGWERSLTRYLYGGDDRYRLAQEMVLGIGGFRMLKELGFTGVYRFHMNEGHASLLTLELYNRTRNVDYVRKQCVFTTHTPVPAGHDQFDLTLARSLLGDVLPEEIIPDITFENRLNMTKLGLFFSHYING
ncbi:MAG TPA: alpha-glucan family phosphorylase, partial [Thermoplasmatales archaeon]|nr:alpha-glucan family phosphorylase [Thermoplasmatales archaeon]